MLTAMELRRGLELVGGYRLTQLRGNGSDGSVWEGESEAGPLLAFHFFPRADDQAARQQMRVIRLLGGGLHPNLLRVQQVWCHDHYLVVTMPLADGSLLDLLDAYQTEFRAPPPRAEVCFYLAQVAAALDFLSARQHEVDGRRVALQHGAVKPSNLLLFDDTVKLSDFRHAGPAGAALARRPADLRYAAPEILQGRLSDRADQYALAVTYFHLRTGRLPTTTANRPQPDLGPLPEKERPIIARALAPAPWDRWPSCAALVEQLNRLTD
jgi:serine/threonine-protein kinase